MSHPPKPATLWMRSQPSPVIVGLWPVSHMFSAGPSPAWTRGGQNTAALPKSDNELNMGIPLETIFIQGSCKCIVYLIPLKPSLGVCWRSLGWWIRSRQQPELLFFFFFSGGQMKIARRITGQTLVLKLVRDWSCMFQCVLFVAPCLELHCCCRTLSDRCSSKHRLWTCYGKKGPHRPLTNWGLETTIGERVKDLLAKHKHEHTMGRTWRMLSRFQSRRNMKDEGIDDEDSDFCWIAQKDHGLLVEKAWAQI